MVISFVLNAYSIRNFCRQDYYSVKNVLKSQLTSSKWITMILYKFIKMYVLGIIMVFHLLVVSCTVASAVLHCFRNYHGFSFTCCKLYFYLTRVMYTVICDCMILKDSLKWFLLVWNYSQYSWLVAEFIRSLTS